MISAYEQAKVEEVYIKSKSQHIIIYFAWLKKVICLNHCILNIGLIFRFNPF
jgi:hypothetical protein